MLLTNILIEYGLVIVAALILLIWLPRHGINIGVDEFGWYLLVGIVINALVIATPIFVCVINPIRIAIGFDKSMRQLEPRALKMLSAIAVMLPIPLIVPFAVRLYRLFYKDNGKWKTNMNSYEKKPEEYKMKYKAVYLSEFSDVFYVVEKNVVLVHWKKYCELEQYRTPLENALKVIKDHSGCNYVADTRDGFEDNPRDTEWVAGYFMPKAKEYGCQIIYFIIDKSNSLKEELEGQEKDSSKLLEFRYIYGMDEI